MARKSQGPPRFLQQGYPPLSLRRGDGGVHDASLSIALALVARPHQIALLPDIPALTEIVLEFEARLEELEHSHLRRKNYQDFTWNCPRFR
jgi:hypothetical protein